MRAYVASRFMNRVYVLAFMVKTMTMQPLSGAPLVFTQTWHKESIEELLAAKDEQTEHEYQRNCAVRDLQQLDDADMVIVLTDGCENVPGGMHFEAGYAHAKGKRIIVIGPRVHVFYHMDVVEWYPTVAEYLGKNYVSVLDARARSN